MDTAGPLTTLATDHPPGNVEDAGGSVSQSLSNITVNHGGTLIVAARDVSHPNIAIQTLQGIVGAVEGNKDELARLSNHLQLMIQSLEDSRQRDVIRQAEYEASLSAVFGLIERTERTTRLMLRRSLGDKTWSAREITGELRRLNEDVQAFSSSPMIGTVDFAQTTQSQQGRYPVGTREDIIARITEIDRAILRQRSVANPCPPATARMMAKASTDQSPSHESGKSSAQYLQARGLEPATQLGRSAATSSSQASQEAKPMQTSQSSQMDSDVELRDDPKDLVRRLISKDLVTLTIEGLHKLGDPSRFYGEGHHQEVFRVPGSAGVDQIKAIVQQAGYHCPENLQEDDTIHFRVTDGDSVYDATAGGLQINKNEPLLWWMNKYDEYHGFAAPVPMKTDLVWSRDRVKVDDLTVRLHRTLRVPDSDTASQLPPNMGTFPLFSVAQLGTKVPEDIKKRGGFITPMFRREALWIQFNSAANPAVKVSVGGVNVISGASASDPSPLQSGPQDYIVAGLQPWIDGIVTEPGTVRQFVVTEMHKGYTVEEQVTGEAKVGGFQFDIYPRRPTPKGAFFEILETNAKDQLTAVPLIPIVDITATPAELQAKAFHYKRHEDEDHLNIFPGWVLSDYSQRFSLTPLLKAKYPIARFRCRSNFLLPPPEVIRKSARGLSSDVISKGITFNGSALGIAAGGKIKQRIYRVKESPRAYNEQLSRRFHVHILSPEFWEELTGVLPPVTPITRDMYLKHAIPWYNLFDDYMDSITEISGALAAVQSVSRLDRLKFRTEGPSIIDPDSPPFCPQHRRDRSVCVFRPCGHAVCPKCLGLALMQHSKCACGSQITRVTGMKEPMAQLVASDSETEADMDHWSVQEVEQLSLDAVKRGTMVVIHLPEDDVAHLQQYKAPDEVASMVRGMEGEWDAYESDS